MASSLRPLQLLCERRPSIFSFTPEFLSSQKKSFAAASLPAHHVFDCVSHKNDDLDTKYGLQINFENGQITTVRAIIPPPVSDSKTETESRTAGATTESSTVDSFSFMSSPSPFSESPHTHTHTTSSSIPAAQTPSVHIHDMESSPSPHPYTYRLFPDWQTSYLWYGDSYPPAIEDGYWQVEGQEISSRYPMLAPYYFAWQGLYELAFVEQCCHLGQGPEVFPDARERAAWKVEGALMAAWLALGENVGMVEYKPGEGWKWYLFEEKGGMDMDMDTGEVLRGVLRDVDMELGEIED